MKKLMIGAVCAMMAAATFAEPKVEITKAYQAEPGSGIVNYTYTISGLKGVTDLYIKVGAEGCSTTKTLTFTNVKEGTVSASVNATELLGQAYPNVTLFAELEDGVQLWENGPYFAKANLGATKPEEYGWYFWWGDLVGYKRNSSNNGWVSVKDGTAFQFTTGNCPTYNKSMAFLQQNGWTDFWSGNLVATKDAATRHLGAHWRMPTNDELTSLVSNCTKEWKENWNGTGVNGFLVTGKGAYASKSIFLPAAGFGEDASHKDVGTIVHCWTSSQWKSDDNWNSKHLYLKSGDYATYANGRFEGRPVRAVRSAD